VSVCASTENDMDCKQEVIINESKKEGEDNGRVSVTTLY
jgi:hypothetical protein